MLGSFGYAFIIAMSVAGAAISAPFYFLHASHVYVTTLSRSSGGEDRFRWPREGYFEWFGEALAVVAALVASGAIALSLTALLFAVIPIEWAAAAWIALWWLVAPIALCAVMAGTMKGVPLDPAVIGRVFVQPAGMIHVTLVTLPFWGILMGALWFGFVRGNPLGAILFLVAFPAAILLHARAWGRLVWLACNHDAPKPRRKRKKKQVAVEAVAEEVDLEPEDPDDEAAYNVDESIAPTGEKLATMTEWYELQHERERKLREQAGDPNPDVFTHPDPPTYRTALGNGVVGFLLYPETTGVWTTLTLSGIPFVLFAFILVRTL